MKPFTPKLAVRSGSTAFAWTVFQSEAFDPSHGE
jgi:hypothetical protein